MTATPATNPTNDIMFAGLFGLNDAEKEKVVRKQELEGPTENTTEGVDSREEKRVTSWSSRDKGMIQTPPKRKLAVTVEDDTSPAIVIGEFVKVDANTSPGNNRPGGTGFVK